ncbi:MAG: PAS domain S-box protein [Bacteroidia bacterium]
MEYEKIKKANIEKPVEGKKNQLLAEEKTNELTNAHLSTGNLPGDLKEEIAQRKKVENDLIERKLFIESLLHLSSDILYIYDIVEQKNIYSNDGVQHLLGYSVNDIKEMGSKMIEFLMHPDDFKTYLSVTVPQYIKLKNDEAVVHQFRMRCKSGRWLWLDCNEIIYKRDANGEPTQIFGVIHDITNIKHAEFELLESEQNLKRGELIGKFGYWEYKINEDIFYISDGARNIYGFDRNLINYEEIKSARLPEYHSMMDEAMGALISENEPYDVELKIKRVNDGRIVDLSIKAEYNAELNTVFGTTQDITEHKEAELKIRETEKLFLNIFNKNPVTMVLTDPFTGAFLDVNEKFLHDLGYSKEEVIGNTTLQLGLFKDIEKRKQMMEILKREGKLTDFECEFRAKNGKLFTGLLSVVFIKYKGETCQLNSIFDISERKNAEKLIRESEEKYRIVVNSMNEGLMIVDNDDVIQFVNDKLVQFTGYSREELIGKVANELLLAQEYRGLVKQKNLLRTEKISDSYELKYITKTGEKLWVSVSGSPILDAADNVIGSIGVHSDITERKEREKELKSSEERYRSVTQSANDAIVSANSKGRIIGWNPGAQKMFGFSKNDILGQPLDLIIPTNYLEDHRSGMKHYSETGEKRITGKTMEVQGLDSEGKIFPVELSLSDWETNEGVFYTAIIRDITERKNAEALQQKITNDLIHRNKSLEQFTYIVSHNLRSHIANIIGFNNMLNKIKMNDMEKAKVLTGINVSIIKLDGVIKDLNNILNMNRNITEEKEDVQFLHLLTDVEHSLELEIKESQVAIQSDFREVGEMLSIKSYMVSIFQNLISNSIKYRKRGVKTIIEIKTFRLKNGTRISFKDNGLGIDMARNGEKLFLLYHRFHLKHAEGKGVGLYMVKTQVEALGGTIEVQSTPKEGTEFIITFEN